MEPVVCSPIIEKAKLFATRKHVGQTDDDGLPYIQHPQRVVAILEHVTQPADTDVLVAGWLHDTLEDTTTTYMELATEFGYNIAVLVLEVTHRGQKDSKGYYFPNLRSREAIMIKFADRLDNISRMGNWEPKRREQYLAKSRFWKEN